jgi:hypothetical protein
MRLATLLYLDVGMGKEHLFSKLSRIPGPFPCFYSIPPTLYKFVGKTVIIISGFVAVILRKSGKF